jgi:hypothetical protein
MINLELRKSGKAAQNRRFYRLHPVFFPEFLSSRLMIQRPLSAYSNTLPEQI